MKKQFCAAIIALALGACANQTPTQQRVTTGAAAGALGGAGLGALLGGRKGAAVGAMLGAIGGGTAAGATAPKDCWGYDRDGNRIRIICP